MRIKAIVTTITFFTVLFCSAQDQREYKSWNPAADTLKVLEGQYWPREVKDYYDRLPAAAENYVRKDVWNLSKNSAGLQLRFQTNANEIIVKFIVAGGLQMPHMPATGVSGVDLYSKTIDGEWTWAGGQYSFDDTIVYRFSGLLENDQHVSNREYTLYLPLYNSVKWMEVIVPKQSFFNPLPVRNDKPIVVYGTSIAQGGCATRPGLAWTNILGRKLDRPVINLGFSGNGRLEKELIGLLTEVDAKMYVLDCLPNLTGDVSTAELKRKIVASVLQLQIKKPSIPILLTDHDGYTDEAIKPSSRKRYQDVNIALREVFDSLYATGIKNIYLLSKNEIGQDIESMVDGVHPNDIGMMRYAEAYEKKIRTILNEPVGTVRTTKPVTQRRDANIYDWETRHREIMNYNKIHSPGLVLIGNSITHYWAGKPIAPIVRGDDPWRKYFEKRNPVNMGFGWDRIENVLWRVYHGELDGISPKDIVLMIGTNNIQQNTNKEIVDGLRFLIRAIQSKQPAVNILVMGVLPRRNTEERIVELNKMFAKIPAVSKVKYTDAGKLFLKQGKKIDESLFTDGLHPNAAGYEKLGIFINMQLAKGKKIIFLLNHQMRRVGFAFNPML